MRSADLTIAPLSLPAPEFSAFTFPRYQSMLTAADPDATVLALGARVGTTPVGLALLTITPRNNLRLQSMFVDQAHRRQGIARALLEAAEQHARAMDAERMFAFHTDQSLSIYRFVNLLSSSGWKPPEFSTYRLAGKASWVEKARTDWSKFLGRLQQQGVECIFWPELTDADHQLLAQTVTEELPAEDQEFAPDKLKGISIVPEVSLLIFSGDKIAGWIFGLAGLEKDSYYYSSGYVLPQYQRRGLLLAGLYGVCVKQYELFGPESLACYETSRPAMKKLMERQIKPYAEWTNTMFYNRKILKEPSL